MGFFNGLYIITNEKIAPIENRYLKISWDSLKTKMSKGPSLLRII